MKNEERDYVHNWYSMTDDTNLRKGIPTKKSWTKPRWKIIAEAKRDIDQLYLPDRFIRLSGNSLDFAKL